MIIRVCFPYYKECPIHDKIEAQVNQYSGKYTFELYKGQGTIVHDVRNALVTNTLRVNKKNPVLPPFDFLVMIDSDVDCSLEDIIHLIEKDKDVVFLPYELRGHPDKYNAGYLTKKGHQHLNKSTKGFRSIHGGGNGCKAWKRKVFKRVPPFWFWPGVLEYGDEIESLVEDWSFDARARKAGFQVWCDFDRPVKHNLKEPKMKKEISNQSTVPGSIANIVLKTNQTLGTISSYYDALIAEAAAQGEKIAKLEKELAAAKDEITLLELEKQKSNISSGPTEAPESKPPETPED